MTGDAKTYDQFCEAIASFTKQKDYPKLLPPETSTHRLTERVLTVKGWEDQHYMLVEAFAARWQAERLGEQADE